MSHRDRRGCKRAEAERHVLEDLALRSRRALPDVVPATAADARIHGRRPARDRRAPQHQRPVEEQARVRELVDVRGLELLQGPAAAQQDLPAAQLRRALRIALPQKVAHPVRLVLGHQGRPLARDLGADLLELRVPVAGREVDLVVREHVRPHDAAREQHAEHGGLHASAARKEREPAGHRGKQQGGRAGGQRLRTDPRRSLDADRKCAADRAEHVEEQLPRPAPPRPGQADRRGEEQQPDQDVRRGQVGGLEPEVAHRPDARELEPAERLEQVAELGPAGERAARRLQERVRLQQRRRGQHRRRRDEHEARGDGRLHTAQPAPATNPAGQQHGHEPDHAAEAQHREQRRARDASGSIAYAFTRCSRAGRAGRRAARRPTPPPAP